MVHTKEACVRAGADHKVVRLARLDVLEGEDGPVPVLVAGPDVLHLLAGLGEGEHLAAGLVGGQAERVAVGGEGGGRAGIAWLRARAQGDGEVEAKVDSVAHLGRVGLVPRIKGGDTKKVWGDKGSRKKGEADNEQLKVATPVAKNKWKSRVMQKG